MTHFYLFAILGSLFVIYITQKMIYIYRFAILDSLFVSVIMHTNAHINTLKQLCTHTLITPKLYR